MNQIVYTNLGGQPLTQNALAFLQSSFTDTFKAIGRLIGDLCIIDGVVVVGGFASNGTVIIDGEILPFIGGAVGTEVVITETITQKLYNDGITKDTLKTRYATFGSPGIAFTGFSRLGTLKNMFYSLCPIGAVVPYEGLVADLPTNWMWHSVSKGRVIIGQDPDDPDFANIGDNGGEKEHTMTANELFPHNHNVSEIGDKNLDPVGTYRAVASNTDGATGLNIDIKMKDTGGGQPFNILQPYFVLAMIKRVS